MKNACRISALLAGIVVAVCPGLSQHKPTTQYVQTTLTDKNGLPQNSVNAIAQTTDGYLWFGTEEGLARYDGLHVTVFDTIRYKTLKDNYIDAITAGRDGSLWIGTRSGLTRLKDGQFHTYLSAQSPITTITEARDGQIWVGGLDGLYSINGEQIRRYGIQEGLPGNAVNSIEQGLDGTLWLGTNRGLAGLKDGVISRYGADAGLPTDSIAALVAGKDGSLWIAFKRGLIKWNGKLLETLPAPTLPEQGRITSLLESHDGTLWIGFEHSGIASLRNGELVRYSLQQGLPSGDAAKLFEDRQGNLWVGLFEGGVVELRNGTFSTFGEQEGLSENMIWSVLQARDGSLWVGTNSKGLDHIDKNGNVRRFTVHDGLPPGSVFGLLESRDGTLWVGSEHGEVSHIVKDHIQVFRDPANRGARVSSILEDSTGDLLLGFHEVDGLVRFHGGAFQHYKVPGLLNTMKIAPDGSIWVGTDHSGVVHIQGGSVTAFTTQNGLLSNFAQAVYVDRDGVVWVGTSPGGLDRISNGRITTYSIDQGLFDLTVGAITEDDDGYLWMTCNKGIYKVSKKELNDFAEGRISAIHSIVYGTADGLRNPECNFAADPSVWKGNHRLWFATTAGVASVDPSHSQSRFLNPTLLFEQVRFNGKPLPFGPQVLAGPGGGDLEIQFTAPDFIAPARIRFRYRLRGFDSDWVDVGERRQAIYTKLPPGSYDFELQGTMEGQGWDSKIAKLPIRLAPHFWQTRWFQGLCGLALLLAFIAGYRVRVRYLIQHNRELEERVNQRTVELQKAIRVAEDAQNALREQATKDGLTKLWNRSTAFEMLEKEVARAKRDHQPVSILMADLDHFKSVNDTNGHLIGDRVLQGVAARIEKLIRPYDFAGRYGGEEFMIVLPGCSIEDGMKRAEEVRREIEAGPISASSATIRVTCSLGVASLLSNMSAEELIDQADAALYCAKRAGRNRVHAGAQSEIPH